MTNTFRVNPLPDGGSFADGDSAALAWDILHRAGNRQTASVLDLSECKHLKPYALACLCGLGLLAKSQNSEMSAIEPKDSGCADHLARMGVPAFFSGDWESQTARETNICVSHVCWPPGSEGERIVEVLAPRAGLPSGMFPKMVAGLDEVILNALTHADSEIDCVVAGQAFPSTNKVEVAVLDLGCTIRGHLTRNPRHESIQSDRDAILKAFEEGVTGTPSGQRNSRGDQNSGAGLAYLREYCESGGGELTVLSGDAWITVSARQGPVFGTIRGGFRGSLVNIRFSTDLNLPSDPIVPIL